MASSTVSAAAFLTSSFEASTAGAIFSGSTFGAKVTLATAAVTDSTADVSFSIGFSASLALGSSEVPLVVACISVAFSSFLSADAASSGF